jgi:hypothetical protein
MAFDVGKDQAGQLTTARPLWTNTEFEPTRQLCAYTCGSCVGRRHLERAQRGSWAGAGERRSQGLCTLYALPPALCEEIAAFADERVNP